jgi:serine protease Do
VLLRIVAVVLLGSSAALAAQSARPPAPSTSAADRAAVDRAIAAVYPSLVRVSVVVRQWSNGREIRLESSGSGTIVSPDGYVVTNHHVAGRATRIVCTLPTNEEIPAELVGTDPMSDIALLKLQAAEPRTFPAARFGRSAGLRRGDPVLAMGSPLSLSQSVTRGIVSNPEMILPQASGAALALLDGEDVGTIVKWIGHDAAIHPGNSGGPLVNLAGEIIGINEISFGLGGAIPGDLARHVVEALKRDGRVRRAWAGLEVQPRVDGLQGPGGLISWVATGSPAEAAGVEVGDVLLRVGELPVDLRFAEQVPPVNQALLSLPIGEPSRLVLRRDGRELTVRVTPVERGVAASVPAELRDWGVVAADISPLEARALGRESVEGVRVLSLRPGGPANQARPSLERDDVIVAIEGRPVRSVVELRSRTAEAQGDRPRASVLVEFERGLERRLAVVEVGTATPANQGVDALRPWVPVSVQVLVPAIAERLGLGGRTGVRVTRTLDDSAPLRVGDVILAIDDEPVGASAPTDEDVFATAIRRYRLGSTVTLTVFRDGAELTLPVALQESPRLARDMARHEDADLAFRVRDLTAGDRDDPRLQDVAAGVLVEAVSEGGWAALARLRAGDIIQDIDGQPAADVAAFSTVLRAAVERRPSSIVLQVRRGVRTLFVEIKPEW